MGFPEGFVWGASTSAYQIEGGHDADGKGPSIWDDICRKPGAIKHDDTGDVACDHYHRFAEDVGLMSEIGLRAYRFSIAWSRVLPAGVGEVNAAGLGFYDALVDKLLEANIEPWITLYHWDMPLALHRRGGWLNRDSAEWFGEYTRVMVDRLSDRVSKWITINEPQCFWNQGYSDQSRAPGVGLTYAEFLAVIHNVLRAHGRSSRVIRERAKTTPSVGWAPVGVTWRPASARAEDIEATRQMVHGVRHRDPWNNTWYNDPIFFGRYPEDGLKLNHDVMPTIEAGDLELIHTPMDFLGINTYQGDAIRMGKNGPEKVPEPAGFPRNVMGWPIVPEVLYWGPKLIGERYDVPLYQTENGMAAHDWVASDGRVHDTHRIDFLHRYIGALKRAVEDGVNIRGYFHWSLLDNFEWREGYEPRFGLVHVDYQTLKRTPKDSAAWYARVIETNGGSLEKAPAVRVGSEV
ncbi:MAG: GH1 family beta-glucosidase [Phycisphaerales bacterium]